MRLDSRSRPALAWSTVDRAAHRRTDPQWLAEAWERAQVMVVDVAAGGRFLVRDSDLVLFAAAELGGVDPAERMFLGVGLDGTPYFAVIGELPEVPQTRAANLREVGHELDERDGGLAITAVALGHWHAAHPYAPANGQPTAARDGGWVRTGDGGEQLWPRTDPAVIVLVHDGGSGPEGRCLLGHNAAWAAPGVRRFSCLAGFVEPGESAEAAVAREVAEEVGVAVEWPAYVASQAWPFPGSLMLGFLARGDPDGPVQTDPSEITHAQWFTRREIDAALSGETVLTEDGTRLGLPMPASIAYFLITTWLAGGEVGGTGSGAGGRVA
jgi:NAD+ diphosphatase